MKTNKKRRFWTVLCIILAVVLALLLGLTILVNSFLNKIQRYDPVEETISEEEIQQIIEANPSMIIDSMRVMCLAEWNC